MLDLRYYQQEAVNAVYVHLQTKPDTNPCVVLPTGAGKSIVIAKICSDAVTLWGGRVLILAHVKELLEQNAAKVAMLCPEIKLGMFSAGLGRRDKDTKVVVAGIQSVYNKAADLGAFDIVMIDEAHLIPPDGDGMYQTFLTDTKKINSNVRLIGFTATPYRLKGGLICKKENLLNEIAYEIGVKDLIIRGYLSQIRSKNGKIRADFSDLHIRSGEFVADEVSAKMDNDRLVSAACTEIAAITKDRKKVLIFASSVQHAQHIRKEITRITDRECAIVTGNTSKDDRAAILDRFRGHQTTDLFGEKSEDLKYLVNVAVLTTGFDAPETDCVVLLRPTASAGLYYQMVGRGFRLAEGKKDCLILDYGENIMRHGPIDFIRIDEKERGNKKKLPPPVRECPECQAVFHAGRVKCPDCGYEFPRTEQQLHHGTQAASDGILSGQVSETEFFVKSVFYRRHVKRGDPAAHPTLRVEYEIGFNDYVSEWICPEHSGYARSKSEKWWKERTGNDLPSSVDECLLYARAGKIPQPERITLRKVPGSSFPTIIKVIFPEKQDFLSGPEIPEDLAMQYAEETVRQNYKERDLQNNTWIDLDADPEEVEERLAIMEDLPF